MTLSSVSDCEGVKLLYYNFSTDLQSSGASKEEVLYMDYQDTHHVTSEDIIRKYKEQTKLTKNHDNMNGHHEIFPHPKETTSNDNIMYLLSRSNSNNGSTEEQKNIVETMDTRNHDDEDMRTRGTHVKAEEEEEGCSSQGDASDQEDDEAKDGTIENAFNSHSPFDEDDDNREFFEYLDSFGEDGERVMSSSSDTEVGGVDVARAKIIHLDHVDYILDNIDAELSHLINKVRLSIL